MDAEPDERGAPQTGQAPAPTGLVRRTVVSLLAIALLLGAGAAAFRRFAAFSATPPKAPGGAPLAVVRVSTLAETDFVETLRGYGVARVLREARVAAEVPGVVRRIADTLRVGALVEAPSAEGNGGPSPGAVLVEIDARDLEDALARLDAARKQVEADLARNRTEVANLDAQLDVAARRLETARAEQGRIERLVAQETLAESELDRQRLAVFALEQMESEVRARRDQTVANRAVLEAQFEANQVEARQARRDLTRTRVTAPFDGRVLARHVEVGSRVAPGTPLFDLVDPRRVEVGVALPAGQYAAVDANSTVRIRLVPDGPVVWEGPVLRVDPAIDPESRTFRVWVEAPGRTVAPGASVIADVTGRRHPAVLPVPREAFLGDTVFVAEPTDEDGVAVARRRRPTIAVTLPRFALVPTDRPDAGVSAGDAVVVSNLEDIADGSRIRTVAAEAEAPGP